MTKGKSEAPLANSAGTEIGGNSIACVLFAKGVLLAVLAYGNLGLRRQGHRSAGAPKAAAVNGARRARRRPAFRLHLISATIVAHSLNGPVGPNFSHRRMRMTIMNDISSPRN